MTLHPIGLRALTLIRKWLTVALATVGLSTFITVLVFIAKVDTAMSTTLPDHEARISDVEMNIYLICLLNKQNREAELKQIKLVLNIDIDCQPPGKKVR